MESTDELHCSSHKSILKALEAGGISHNMCKQSMLILEIIFRSCLVQKFNERSKRQNRGLLITNKAIYNLSKTSKRLFANLFRT